jgi:phage gp36-like protein
MPYATQPQIVIACGGQAAFDQLFDYDGDGVADATVIAQAQTAADALINSYLWLRYKTVDNPSPVLQMLAADEAVFYARKYRPALGVTPDDVKQQEMRIATLEKMSRGEIRPDDPAPPSSNAGNRAVFVDNCSDMSRANSKGSIW